MALALAVTGCSTEAGSKPGTGTGTGTGIATGSGTGAAKEPAPPAPPAKDAAADPVHVSIPAIKVSSELLRLGLNSDRTVEVPTPEQGMTAGWYTGGAAPGEKGAAVIIGHNDTKYGPAVFKNLKKLGKGAKVTVRDARGKNLTFTVTATETVRKTAFPTQRVYGPTDTPELRLVTCDGEFDAAGHPVDNLIVYAKL
ncbi:class F sortase [Streptomyces qinzhouensis]|uniref:Class F sortase n=1 Tax=Streptomyces qinzhouensis TaxID=2599401 RepID=A0A5B8JK85_9ACTN|nr:class F sortase [Streptomyces qinzhouensis]